MQLAMVKQSSRFSTSTQTSFLCYEPESTMLKYWQLRLVLLCIVASVVVLSSQEPTPFIPESFYRQLNKMLRGSVSTKSKVLHNYTLNVQYLKMLIKYLEKVGRRK